MLSFKSDVAKGSVMRFVSLLCQIMYFCAMSWRHDTVIPASKNVRAPGPSL